MRIDIHHYIHFDGDIAARVERLEALGAQLMDLSQDMNAQVDRLNSTVGILTTAFEGLTGDLQSLKNQIADLQASGGISEQDGQALLASLTAANDRVAAVATSLAALDAQTPPPAP